MKHIITLAILILAINFSFSQETKEIEKIDYGNNPKNGKSIKINGINLYYESYGKGYPLFLLHGNGGSIKSSQWKIEYFKKNNRVLVVDSRAHGKSTDDLTIKLNYRQMSEDIAALMDSLNIKKANIWGQSDGGIIGLLLAINHPNKVNKLATFGANIRPGTEAVFEEIQQVILDTLKTTKNIKTQRHHKLMLDQPNISLSELAKITCPVLIMSGDRDAIKLEHTLEIFNNIENGNLFIMPGSTHGGSWQKPELFNKILEDFLDKPFTKKSTVDYVTGEK